MERAADNCGQRNLTGRIDSGIPRADHAASIDAVLWNLIRKTGLDVLHFRKGQDVKMFAERHQAPHSDEFCKKTNIS
jgi:hypothetical protein